MASISMQAVCGAKNDSGRPWTAMAFSADKEYVPDGNEFPPYISISVNVSPEIAADFELGGSYTLTLTSSDD